MKSIHETPLLSADSPLDAHSREVIAALYAREQAKTLTLPTDDPLDPARRKRVGHTWTEIWEQPTVVRQNLAQQRAAVAEAAAYVAQQPLEHIYLTGCGDSLAVMTAVRALYEKLLNIPCEAIQALDLAYYYHRPLNERALVVTLSSSGATTRTVEAMLVARARGAATLTLSNTPESPLMVESSRGILIDAQRKGWPTQSSTAAMALLYQLAIDLARERGQKNHRLDQWQEMLVETPAQIERTLQELDKPMEQLAEAEAARPLYLFVGGGPSYATALFGAAKVRECSPNHAFAIPLEEYHHYNSQKAGEPLFLVAPDGPSLSRALDTTKEGQRWGGQVYSFVAPGSHTLDAHSDRVFTLPVISELLSPLVYVLPLQLFAYRVTMAKFALAEAQAQLDSDSV